MRAVSLALLGAALATSLDAQQQAPFRVAGHAPRDAISPLGAITVTFDRAAAGSVGEGDDPGRAVRVEPDFPRRVEWRDPVTLVIRPTAPLPPGARYDVTVGREVAALDGRRLDAPYRFSIRVRGARLLATRPGLPSYEPALLPPDGRIALIYDSPVDLEALARGTRLQLTRGTGCARARAVSYLPVAQRPVGDVDASFRYVYQRDDGDYGVGDTTILRFRRVVELRPETPPPEGCSGTLRLPSLDPSDPGSALYAVRTTPPFTLADLSCTARGDCPGGALVVTFSTPVRRRDALAHVHLDPAVPFRLDAPTEESASWAIATRVSPRTTYQVTVDSEMTDIHGRRITGARTASIASGDRRPALVYATGLVTLPRAGSPVLRVRHVNVDSAEVLVVAVRDDQRGAAIAAARPRVAGAPGARGETSRTVVALVAPLNVEGVTDVPLPRDLLARHPSSLFTVRVTPRRASPPLALVAPSPYEPVLPMTFVQVTDLMAHAKTGAGGGSVFVTDARNGDAVSGARVTLRDARDRVTARGITDARGLATLAKERGWRSDAPARSADDALDADDEAWRDERYGDRYVEVSRGDDRSITLSRGDYYDRDWAFEPRRLGASAGSSREVRALPFTSRDIYRPGEVVHAGVVVRLGPLGALRAPPHGDAVRWSVERQFSRDGDPEQIRDTVGALTEFGTAADSFRLRPTVRLGAYTVRVFVRRDGRWRWAGESSFQVAEYRAPEFLVELTADSAVHMLGDTLQARAAGHFLFGAPMARATLQWRAKIEEADPSVLAVPGLPREFVVGERRAWWDGDRGTPGQHLWGNTTLDERGGATIAVPTVRGALSRPGRITIEAAVEDANGQVVSASASAPVHAAALYVAARDSAGSWTWTQGTRQTVQLIAIRPDGRRVSGVRIRAAVVRRRWEDSSAVGSGGRWAADTVARDSMVSADSVVALHYTPSADGPLEVVLSARDEAGGVTRTRLDRYVVPTRWAGSWGDNPIRLFLAPQRERVAAGDTAVVTFTSPFRRAEAWVTVEREGILDERRLTVGGGTNTLRLAIDERHVPNAFVSVVLVDHATASGDSTHQRLRVGYVALTVDDAPKRLAVVVTPGASEYRPADSASVVVRVRDAAGRGVRSQVTLWAVDEGVLSLTGYQRPDPLAAFYVPGGVGLRFHSTFSTLRGRETPELRTSGERWFILTRAARLQLSEVIVSGAGAEAPSPVRSDFRSTAFFLSSLVTDDEGVVRAKAALPDNVTTYRVIAVAVSAGDRYGSGEASLLVTKPLLARSSLPRFVRPGDEMLAGATVNGRDGRAREVRVTARGSNLQLIGAGEQRSLLEPGRGAEARFRWRAVAADSARVRFAVSADGMEDAVEVGLPVRPTFTPRVFTIAGMVRDSATVRFALPAGIDPARSRLTVRVGTTPLTHVRTAYDQLRAYPYLCSEQLTSAGLAAVAVLRLERAGAAPGTDVVRVRAELQRAVDELTRRQRDDGGVGYWSRSHWTTPWLSAYTGLLLLDARDLDVAVDGAVLRRLATYLTSSLADSAARPDTLYGTRGERARAFAGGLSNRLAALHYLRRAGTPAVRAEDSLLTLAPRLTWEDRAWLAELLARRRDRRREGRELLATLWRGVALAGARIDFPDSTLATTGFPSHMRPPARLLAATLAAEPDHPMLGALVERVVQQQRAGRDWAWNTQDYASVASSLAAVASATRSKDVSLRVRSAVEGGAPLLERRFGREGTSDSSIALGGLLSGSVEAPVLPLRLEARGGAVYYWLTVTEVPLERPVTAEARGITVQRWYERLDDGRAVTELRPGELVRVRLRITVPADREFVAVEDPLPAGLEVVDMSLRTSTTLAPGTARPPGRPAAGDGDASDASWRRDLHGSWYGGWWSPWEHSELRDDRVLWFARALWSGTYSASYVARATTAGTFVRPPAHAEEMYNPALDGRSDGGTFGVTERRSP